MSTNLIERDGSDLTIQQVSRRTGLAESALRYYERIGLIDPVPRDESSGHRRYPPDQVAAIESLSCLRGTGMSVEDMRAYIANMERGQPGAADQHALFARHAERLRREIARLQLRQRTCRPRPNCGPPESTATRPPKNASHRPRSNSGPTY
jgi:DNA-binding transcriptional MerR regulator